MCSQHQRLGKRQCVGAIVGIVLTDSNVLLEMCPMELERAFLNAGWTISRLARAQSLSHEAVRLWFRGIRKIDPHRCQEVERLTGVPRHVLRPDIYAPPTNTAAQ